MTLLEGERNCYNCGISETQTELSDVSLPPLIKRQDLCKKCLNIILDNERKRKSQ
jgi:hypothetical protein